MHDRQKDGLGMAETGAYPGLRSSTLEAKPRPSAEIPPMFTMKVYLAVGIPGRLA